MKNYDLVVVGGGSAGCAAAYIAGKLGLKTLLIEKRSYLGGAISANLVVPAMKSGNDKINTDFFDDFCTELKALSGQITYQGNKGWFNPELTKIALDNMMLKAGVEVLFNTYVSNIYIDNKTIKHIILSNEILSVSNDSIYNFAEKFLEPIEPKFLVDSTGNCEIGKLCGCEFINKPDEIQPVSLRFIMSNVDLKRFSDWLLEYDKDRNVTTVEKIDGEIHLSTAYTWDTDKNWALRPLFDKAVKNGELKDTDRNYFQIFTIAGMPSAIAFNCPRMIDNDDYSETLINARGAVFRISKFCQKYFPGFEKAYISNIASDLGVRVSNRIKGKYVYTIEDLKSGKVFKNPVLISDYPIDIHSNKKNSSTLYKTGTYQLPIESLMSADISNLFVAGRCLSADFMAQGALRIQPSCFSMGEGVSKYIKSLLI